MVVGEAKAIYMALRGDGKGEVGTTEGILESDMAPASPGFQHHTLGDQESFCRQRAGQGQWQTHTASPLCPICFSFTAKALAGRLGRDSCPYYTEEETEARKSKCLTQTPTAIGVTFTWNLPCARQSFM